VLEDGRRLDRPAMAACERDGRLIRAEKLAALRADSAMRRPLLSGADSDELAANLDHGRIVDLHVAGHLRLRLGCLDGRCE
jgi:hypothetical protein